jgi:hypothetical protein
VKKKTGWRLHGINPFFVQNKYVIYSAITSFADIPNVS